jgi:hypothetical protein
VKIDFEKGAFIEIGGELGKYNSLPIDDLVRISQDLQELVLTIAKFDLPSEESIDIQNFKLELVGFTKGSALPKFAYTQRVENKTGILWKVQREKVNEKFEKLIEISNTGEYGKLKVLYPEPVKRNPIVDSLYAFTNSFGSAPVSFVDYDENNNKIVPLYKVSRFKTALKDELKAEIKKEDEIAIYDEAFAKLKITSQKGKVIKRKILDTYSNKKHSLDYAPTLIISGNRKYYLKFPLRCLFEKEKNYHVIQSEMLGIIGTGLTEDEAEISFNEEFDYIFQRLNSLENDKLTNHNQLAKTILTQIVEKVEQ